MNLEMGVFINGTIISKLTFYTKNLKYYLGFFIKCGEEQLVARICCTEQEYKKAHILKKGDVVTLSGNTYEGKDCKGREFIGNYLRFNQDTLVDRRSLIDNRILEKYMLYESDVIIAAQNGNNELLKRWANKYHDYKHFNNIFLEAVKGQNTSGIKALFDAGLKIRNDKDLIKILQECMRALNFEAYDLVVSKYGLPEDVLDLLNTALLIDRGNTAKKNELIKKFISMVTPSEINAFHTNGDFYRQIPLLNHAVDNCGTKVVKMFIDKGVDTNVRDDIGRTPLMVLANKNKLHKEKVELLLSASKEDILSTTDEEGKNAFYHAVQKCNLDFVKNYFRPEELKSTQNPLVDLALKARDIFPHKIKHWKTQKRIYKIKETIITLINFGFPVDININYRGKNLPLGAALIVNGTYNTIISCVIEAGAKLLKDKDSHNDIENITAKTKLYRDDDFNNFIEQKIIEEETATERSYNKSYIDSVSCW